MAVKAPSAAAMARHLQAAVKRAEEIEPKLAATIEPILSDAGREAAKMFTRYAVDHLSAAAARAADVEAALLIDPADLRGILSSLALTAAGNGVTPTSTMIAVKPRPAEAATLADATDADADRLHVTLAYLGKTEGDLSPLVEALARVAGTHAPLSGQVGGVGAFGDNGNGHPNILLPSVPGLVELRVSVTQALADASVDFGRQHGFLPHLTVSYSDSDPDVPATDAIGSPLHFDEILVVRGDQELHRIPLTGSRPITAAADADPPKWTAPVANELIDAEALVLAIKAKTDPVRRAVIETVMTGALQGVGIDFDATNPYTANVLAASGRHVASIAETTQQNLTQIITSSYREGLSIPHTAEAIMQGMTEAAPIRATLIARTEMAGAVNGGSLAATQIVAEATGVGYRKQWLTAPGARFPRHEDYAGLDGQTVGLDAYFTVGESQMQYPGDQEGDVGDVVNCRCTLIYVDAGGEQTGDEVEAEEDAAPSLAEIRGESAAVTEETAADTAPLEEPADAGELASSVYAEATAAEPGITADMEDLVAASGGELSGLQYRLKGQESLARKIAADAREKNITTAESAASINDAIRYTAVYPEADYVASAKGVLDDLAGKGYEVLKVKNYWQRGDSYNGINAVLHSPAGTRLELQFHTPESLRVKQDFLHPLYEEYRVSGDAQERARLRGEMVSHADQIPFPKDVASIGTMAAQ